ncbi:Sugar isomerase (SIS) [Penicillium lagena]|uniref:Sugar isomerase (SIS) n=1 Tax=Penicillium lagena TaxID=94218 RepID=UPI0025404A7D|nr:Sugar isomerase (SIS) [Penicillium lagena]KAJ5612443.1 Sugar isomerase (SIS) [Penicillium lagena]
MSSHNGLSPWPLTPPDQSDPHSSPTNQDVSTVVTAIHVLSTERAALAHLEHIYQTDARAQQDLARAVEQIARSVREGGKLVVCGVGKSGKIGRKIEATMNSLGVYSAFLHPTEALHGDLGLVRPSDTMLLISFSGRSPELIALLPHIPASVPVIALTSHTSPYTCPLLSLHGPSGMGILLPAPIHEDEGLSFGVGAPTSSTTVALSLGDALAIATARKLHTTPGKGPAEVFRSFHPGGAIGAATAAANTPTTAPPSDTTTAFDSPTSSVSTSWDDPAGGTMIPCFSLQPPPKPRQIPRSMLVPIDQIPTVPLSSALSPHDIRLLDILLTAIQHPDAKSWVFLSSSDIVPPRRFRSVLAQYDNVDRRVCQIDTKVSVPRTEWLLVSDSTSLEELRQMISTSRDGPDPVSVIAVVDDIANMTRCIGVMEAADLWDE